MAVLKKIRRAFGPDVFKKKSLDRKALARRIFGRPVERKKLERILHPIVRREYRKAVKRRGKRIAVCDVPLLFESRGHYKFEKVIVVDAPLAVRLKRLERRGFSASDARARMKAQWPLAKKVKRADFVIRNGGSIQTTQAQVNRLWALLDRGTYGIA
jgi:dephospho-CoA kinase